MKTASHCCADTDGHTGESVVPRDIQTRLQKSPVNKKI